MKAKARWDQLPTIGVASGQMLNDLKWPVEIGPRSVTGGFKGSPTTEHELDWFVPSDEARNWAPPDIVGIDPEMDAAIDAALDEALDAALGGMGQS